MKKLWLTFLLATTVHAATAPTPSANGWKVEISEEDEVYAESPSVPGLRVPLQAEANSPHVIGWEKAPKGSSLWILTYSVGPVGTQQIYVEERRAVVDVARKEVLTDLVWKYRSEGGSPEIRQPSWDWKASKLEVKDTAFGRHFEVGIR